MRNVMISEDIVPVGQFKNEMAKYLKQIKENNNSLVITQNGKPAGVLISPEEYDKIMERKRFIESVEEGLNDIANGRTVPMEQVKKMIFK
jgi:prevent-host-death family protein